MGLDRGHDADSCWLPSLNLQRPPPVGLSSFFILYLKKKKKKESASHSPSLNDDVKHCSL